MKLIKDGNIAPWLQTVLVIVGLVIIYLAFKYVAPLSWWGIVLALFGLLLAAIGGYSSRAATLKIKPFDRSYEKARASYKEDFSKETKE